MLACEGSTEPSSDEDGIPGLGAGAEGQMGALHGACGGNRDDGRGAIGYAGGFSSNEQGMMLAQAIADACIEPIEPSKLGLGADGNRDEKELGFPTHRREVRDDPGDGFPADLLRWGIRQEMDAADDGISLEQLEFGVASGEIHDSAIVTWSGLVRGEWHMAQKAFDERVLANISQGLHGEK